MLARYIKSCTIVFICIWLSGCVAVAGGAVATGAVVANDRRTTGTFVEDQAIEIKAARELNSDTEIRDNTHISITSYNTVVLMTGETPSEDLRRKAVEIVRHVPAVTKVYNEIAVAAPSSYMSRSSDTMITTKVKTKLFGQEGLDATKVKVVTERGIVYLLGLLDEQEASIATEAARQVGGVQKVVKLFQPYSES